MTGTRGRRIHHLWAFAATGLLLWSAPPLARSAFAQATPGAVAGNAMPNQASGQGGGGYVQTGVPAEATADNAVIARERALSSAQKLAFDRMASELGLSRSADSSQIDSLVSSVVIEQERTTRTSYSGRVTVNFNPDRVRGFSGGTLAGAPPSGSVGDPASAAPPPIPASAYLDVGAVYASPREWIELRKRLLSSQVIADIGIRAIAVDGARLRLGLRAAPGIAVSELARVGVQLTPGQGGMVSAPMSPAPMSPPGYRPGGMAPPVPYGAPQPTMPAPGAGGGEWLVSLAGRA